jgi:hypothetical protein
VLELPVKKIRLDTGLSSSHESNSRSQNFSFAPNCQLPRIEHVARRAESERRPVAASLGNQCCPTRY